ncbi:uncharacterized protein LOC128956693 [Oppia nitens]|uniref:uncharacterized protein LOC128956693 n=1 Tax=Oppia nitens TaxID=1686743 RepID=UPI0023DA92D4|nr:uncharacterized protein LOC128956693 [Oppia nitens]
MIDIALAEFRAMFDTVIDHVLDESLADDIDQTLRSSLKQMYDYVVRRREFDDFAEILITAYSVLSDRKPGDRQFEPRVYALAWAVVLTTVHFDLLGDVMDGTASRDGQPCWHTLPDVGMSALNDSTILLSGAFNIIDIYFKDHPNYLNIVHCIQQCIEKTALGQLMNIKSTRTSNHNVNLEDTYTYDRYKLIYKYKDGHFVINSFLLGMYASGRIAYDHLDTIGNVLTEFNTLVVIVDDLTNLDTDDNSSTDIADGKCTWPIIKSMQLANNSQRTVLEANYGRGGDDPTTGAVQLVKQVYDELDICAEGKRFVKQELQILRQHCLDISADDYQLKQF